MRGYSCPCDFKEVYWSILEYTNLIKMCEVILLVSDVHCCEWMKYPASDGMRCSLKKVSLRAMHSCRDVILIGGHIQ